MHVSLAALTLDQVTEPFSNFSQVCKDRKCQEALYFSSEEREDQQIFPNEIACDSFLQLPHERGFCSELHGATSHHRAANGAHGAAVLRRSPPRLI